MSQTHKILKQVLDVQLTENKEVHELQNQVRDSFINVLLPIIESQLDKMTPNGEEISIDKIEIDLGSIVLEGDFDLQLKERLEEKVKDSLRPVFHAIEAGEKSGVHRDEKANTEIVWETQRPQVTAFTALTHFLEKGYFYWSGEQSAEVKSKTTKVRSLVDRVLELNPVALVSYIKRNVHSAKVQQRVFHHFSLDQIKEVSLQVYLKDLGMSKDSMTLFLNEIFSVATKSFTVNEVKTKAIWWSGLIAIGGIEPRTKRKSLLLPVLLKLVQNEYPSFEVDVPKLMERVAANDPQTVQLKSYFEDMGIDIRKMINQLPIVFSSVDFDVLKQEKNVQELKSLLSLKDDVWTEEWIDYIQKASTKELKLEEDKKENTLTSENDLDARHDSSLEEGVFVENAGLIIIWPFLSFLFDHLGWLDEEKNLLESEKPKAISMTQFLVTGEEEVDESQLPLNKLILGIELDEVITNDYKLSEEEKSEAENLLETVIQQWGALRSTSPMGLRQTFMQREGIIYERDGAYLLRVEKKSLDILMEKLPWSIGVVKLKWMPQILIVEW